MRIVFVRHTLKVFVGRGLTRFLRRGWQSFHSWLLASQVKPRVACGSGQLHPVKLRLRPPRPLLVRHWRQSNLNKPDGWLKYDLRRIKVEAAEVSDVVLPRPMGLI